jgi:hypothetical protein
MLRACQGKWKSYIPHKKPKGCNDVELVLHSHLKMVYHKECGKNQYGFCCDIEACDDAPSHGLNTKLAEYILCGNSYLPVYCGVHW